ncbi:MAG: metallophosphoesterase [Pirellulaceae bacterium]|nr:metallophosphoesterase [Pirellulaceae bacterium]
MLLADLLLALLAFLGHVVLWVAAFNLLHASPLSCRLIGRLETLIQAIFVATLAAAAAAWWLRGQPCWRGVPADGWSWVLAAYVGLCWLAAAVWLLQWIRRRWRERQVSQLVSNDTRRIDVAGQLGFRPLCGLTTRLLDWVPGNEILLLQIHHKRLVVPALPAELEGLRIAHLSDLHYAGHVGLPYFEYVMDRVNELQPELIVVTGDVVDRTACLDWIAPTLGRLRASQGKYFVLGNHDLRVADVDRLRGALVEAGWVDMGGRCVEVPVRDVRLLLAGNERPWFQRLPEVPAAGSESGRPLRLLLAHTPDQFPWARRHDFDLMLAGHTHGGQIRLPVIGPLVAPSRFGVRYASGVFYERPTLLHVSRGVSGLQPIRWNCPPEVALLELTREKVSGTFSGITGDVDLLGTPSRI